MKVLGFVFNLLSSSFKTLVAFILSLSYEASSLSNLDPWIGVVTKGVFSIVGSFSTNWRVRGVCQLGCGPSTYHASTPAEKQRMQNVPYTSAVGSIMYAVRFKNILKYLRNTKDMFLVYEGGMKRELRVSCYIDVGYLTDADELKSQTGYVFVLNREAVWIRKSIFGLGVVPTIEETINMYCDNTEAIAIAKDHGVTKGARHFHAKVHYL
ncbi:hypothetical protein Tco_1141908 [Tanacetum coccineum]